MHRQVRQTHSLAEWCDPFANQLLIDHVGDSRDKDLTTGYKSKENSRTKGVLAACTSLTSTKIMSSGLSLFLIFIPSWATL